MGCLDLFSESKESEDIGNEMYVYGLLGKRVEKNYEELRPSVCTNGRLLVASCFLVNPIIDSKQKSYLRDVLYQGVSDLKASIFLSFAGHYRQAMQVLRCCFENFPSGVYFHTDYCQLRKVGADKTQISKLENRYMEWKRTGRTKGIRATIELLRRVDFLTIDEEMEYKQLYQDLSEFVHTPRKYISHEKHEEQLGAEMVCPASTYFSKDALLTWSNSFQQVFATLLKIVLTFHPEILKTESGRFGVDMTKNELKSHANRLRISDRILKSFKI